MMPPSGPRCSQTPASARANHENATRTSTERTPCGMRPSRVTNATELDRAASRRKRPQAEAITGAGDDGAVVNQLLEVRPHRRRGGAVQHRVHVRIEPLDDGFHRLEPRTDRVEDLRLAQAAMCQ